MLAWSFWVVETGLKSVSWGWRGEAGSGSCAYVPRVSGSVAERDGLVLSLGVDCTNPNDNIFFSWESPSDLCCVPWQQPAWLSRALDKSN